MLISQSFNEFKKYGLSCPKRGTFILGADIGIIAFYMAIHTEIMTTIGDLYPMSLLCLKKENL